MQKLFTLGQIIEEVGARYYLVDYVIKSRAIKPVMKASRYRLFTEQQVRKIADELESIKSRSKKS